MLGKQQIISILALVTFLSASSTQAGLLDNLNKNADIAKKHSIAAHLFVTIFASSLTLGFARATKHSFAETKHSLKKIQKKLKKPDSFQLKPLARVAGSLTYETCSGLGNLTTTIFCASITASIGAASIYIGALIPSTLIASLTNLAQKLS